MVGDASNPDDLARACEGMDVAFWLVHSMESGVDFEQADRLAAEQFGEAANAAGVKRIIYLGGLGADNDTRGHNGWYACNWLWNLRGLMDRLHWWTWHVTWST